MGRRVKATLLLGVIFVSLGWTLFVWRQGTTGGSANNGYTEEWGPANGKLAKKPKISDAQLEQVIAACPGEGALRVCSIMEALEGFGDAGAAARQGEEPE